MVTSWIWNSISKDIVEGHSCTSLLHESYGLHYRGGMVAAMNRWYFRYKETSLRSRRKLTKFWNELTRLAPFPKYTCGGCTCGVNKAITDLVTSTQDPLPDVEKAFSMVFAVEKQRAVRIDMVDSSSHIACQSSLNINRREGTDKYNQKRRPFLDKKGLVYTNCRKPRHSRETCFQIHGVPDWYKTLNDKRKKGTVTKGFATTVDDKVTATYTTSSQSMAEMMSKRLRVIQKHSVPSDPITNSVNYVQYEEEFAGNISKPSEIDSCCWIIDSGATTHMC
ncbi:UNVERIFIED_CONTAM: hypothetical protein Sindi_1318400 [Sesamum indicum]